MANINVTIRLDETVKTQADELFSDLGITLTSAINMFLKQAIREQRIPFEVKRTSSAYEIAQDKTLDSISEKLLDKNLEAYKELAK